MSAQASVLFDAPGPLARRRILLANLVTLAAVLAVAVLVLIQMNATGQLSGRRWLAAPGYPPGDRRTGKPRVHP